MWLTLVGLSGTARAATPKLPSPEQIRVIVQQVASEQEASLTHAGVHFRYRVHRVDRKEDTTRDLIESADGNVARLVLHNGKPLTAAEDEGERHRLESLIDTGDLLHRQKEEQKNRSYGVELMRAMPDAMLYTPTPDQPQLPNLERAQIVLDFVPNPAFHPLTMAEGLLTGLAGRLWIDAADHHLVRIELNTTRDLTLAWGLLAKIHRGGTIEFDQRRVAEGVYSFTHVRIHLLLRELMVKTAPYESDLTATDIQPLAAAPTGAAAVRELLQQQVPTR